MISFDGKLILCDDLGCMESIYNDRWSKVKSDWFETKDGKAYCSEHLPAWVSARRARHNKE